MTRRIHPTVCTAFAVVTAMATMLVLPPVAWAQQSDSDAQLKNALQMIQKLADQVAAQDARIRELEAGREPQRPLPPPVLTAPPSIPAGHDAVPSAEPPPSAPEPQANLSSGGAGGHNMAIPGGGPVLNIRGFFDFNFGVGTIANPLVFPIADGGCGSCGNPPTPPHTSFQAGEFDLLFSSKISDHLSFLAELVLGPDTTNGFGLDIERYTLTYRVNPYFVAGVGRFHTSIGYYNTAYHHGNWFSTAEGRPIMYLFEDSGGVLPVHMVGASFTGAVPDTEKLGLHWVAEVGNGLSSDSTKGVQNFNSDRNYKATNLAAYIRPEAVSGLQIGGSWYHDGINPPGLPEVRQNIESAYIVYLAGPWEFLTEGVLESNQLMGTPKAIHNPMAYTQMGRKFGIYEPYFRYQYVNDKYNDPVNLLEGKYYGPSAGIRIDFAEYAAFKLQYNHLFQSRQMAGNGLNAQVAFTF